MHDTSHKAPVWAMRYLLFIAGMGGLLYGIDIAIIAVAAATSLATAAVPKFRAAPAPITASADQATMHTVYVSAKRLSAEEKSMVTLHPISY